MIYALIEAHVSNNNSSSNMATNNTERVVLVAHSQSVSDGKAKDLFDFLNTATSLLGGVSVVNRLECEPKPSILVIDSRSIQKGDVQKELINLDPDFVILYLSGAIEKTELEVYSGELDLFDIVSQAWGDRLILLLDADQLRGHQVRLTKGLAWETTIEDLANEFASNSILSRFDQVANILVSINLDGVFCRCRSICNSAAHSIYTGGDATFVFDANSAEGEWLKVNAKSHQPEMECELIAALGNCWPTRSREFRRLKGYWVGSPWRDLEPSGVRSNPFWDWWGVARRAFERPEGLFSTLASCQTLTILLRL